jgi:DNA-directed RNA polymerase specialized sigma subunit
LENTDKHFRLFATQLERAIAGLKQPTAATMAAEKKLHGYFDLKKHQVDRLASLEEQFRIVLGQHPHARRVYEAFIAHICDERKNVLAARPFFRERQKVFTSRISKGLKRRQWRRLMPFHVNYHFVAFAAKTVRWPRQSRVAKLIASIAEARNALVVANLPLAVSRAAIFYRRTPKSAQSLMDFVQIAADGLISAVDKYCGAYSKVWAGVAIGRMVGNFIENYSSTTLHFYPTDRRKIYRANKLLSRRAHGGVEAEDLVKAVNHQSKGRQKTTKNEITELLAAASIVSADTKAPGEDDVPSNITRYEAPDEARPDYQVEQAQVLQRMMQALRDIPLFYRKFLRLRGIDIDA